MIRTLCKPINPIKITQLDTHFYTEPDTETKGENSIELVASNNDTIPKDYIHNKPDYEIASDSSDTDNNPDVAAIEGLDQKVEIETELNTQNNRKQVNKRLHNKKLRML